MLTTLAAFFGGLTAAAISSFRAAAILVTRLDRRRRRLGLVLFIANVIRPREPDLTHANAAHWLFPDDDVRGLLSSMMTAGGATMYRDSLSRKGVGAWAETRLPDCAEIWRISRRTSWPYVLGTLILGPNVVAPDGPS